MRQLRMTAGLGIARSQDFMPGAKTQFLHSRDFANGCHTWDPRGHEYDVSVRYIRFESPWHSQIWVTACPLLSSRSMFSVLLVVGGWAWIWLCCHYDYFCITLSLTLTWVNILLVYAYSSLYIQTLSDLIKMAKIMKAKNQLLVVVSLVPSNL
jgi:hypothetical protein